MTEQQHIAIKMNLSQTGPKTTWIGHKVAAEGHCQQTLTVSIALYTALTVSSNRVLLSPPWPSPALGDMRVGRRQGEGDQ